MNAIRATQALNKRELESAVPPSASWHADYRDTAYIYIGGLPTDLSEGDVATIFSQFGNPTHLNLVRERDTGKSRGFAFLKYEDQRSCDLAVDNLGGAEVLGRVLRVDHSRYKKREGEDEETWRIERLEGVGDGEESGDEEKRKRRRMVEGNEVRAIEMSRDEEDSMRDYLAGEDREGEKKKHRHHHRRSHREKDRDGEDRRHRSSRRRGEDGDSVDDRDPSRRRSRRDDIDDTRDRRKRREGDENEDMDALGLGRDEKHRRDRRHRRDEDENDGQRVRRRSRSREDRDRQPADTNRDGDTRMKDGEDDRVSSRRSDHADRDKDREYPSKRNGSRDRDRDRRKRGSDE